MCVACLLRPLFSKQPGEFKAVAYVSLINQEADRRSSKLYAWHGMLHFDS